jgi:RNA polymerase sigma-70 factor (TIGR02957 family)
VSEHSAGRDLEDAAAVFASVRGRLFGIAYRMLGSVAEAEDVVQDAWLRWQGADRSAVDSPPAFLATVTTRLAMNVVQSARMRRETYIGPWLPDPVDTSHDPLLGAERGEALSFAMLLLLEKLTPSERAAYVLREAFDYPYPTIADIVQTSDQAARQLVSRARKHLAAERRKPVPVDEQRRLLSAFLEAAQTGDVAALERIFADDVVSYTDGGGVVAKAARKPVVGRERVAKFVAAFSSHFWSGTDLIFVEANGQQSVIIRRGVDETTVLALVLSDPETADTGIAQLLWMMNPAKLQSFA